MPQLVLIILKKLRPEKFGASRWNHISPRGLLNKLLHAELVERVCLKQLDVTGQKTDQQIYKRLMEARKVGSLISTYQAIPNKDKQSKAMKKFMRRNNLLGDPSNYSIAAGALRKILSKPSNFQIYFLFWHGVTNHPIAGQRNRTHSHRYT